MSKRVPFSNVRCRIGFLALFVSLITVSAIFNASGATLQIGIVPRYGGHPLLMDQMALTNSVGQTFSVTRLNFLLSEFALHQRGGSWVTQRNLQAFIGLASKRTNFNLQAIPPGDYDSLRFSVGLGPDINHAATGNYPAEHPLNPNLNGLYWGWAGGYVFFAVEGHWAQPNTPSGYSFHLGNDWMRTPIELPLALTADGDTALGLSLNLEQLFDFEFKTESSSTHSRTNDPIAARLQTKLKQVFGVEFCRPSEIADKAITRAVEAIRAAPGTHPYRFTFSSQFPMPDLPRDNPLTEEGVGLGRMLFGERSLSVNNQQSCRSCHREENAFSDSGRAFSRGAEGAIGERNSMPIFNLAWKKSFFWDGRARSVREQVLEPINNPIEMHENLSNVVQKLSRMRGDSNGPDRFAARRPDDRSPPDYPGMFRRAFGTYEITTDRVAKALEQFILTQLSYNSKFDRAIEGRASLSEEEKRGFQLFVTEYDPRREQYGADCFHCHGGRLFQSQSFANNGLDELFNDVGRFKVTGAEADKGKFAVPSLRNVELTGPYMHDGRFETLEQVVEHYATSVKRSDTLDPNLAKHPSGGVPLSASDKQALVAFLKTLTDDRLKYR